MANDKTVSTFHDNHALLIHAKTAFNGYGKQTPIVVDDDFIRLPEEKDPYVKLARAILLRAVDDALLPPTKSNMKLIEDAQDFLFSSNNLDREFWQTVAGLR